MSKHSFVLLLLHIGVGIIYVMLIMPVLPFSRYIRSFTQLFFLTLQEELSRKTLFVLKFYRFFCFVIVPDLGKNSCVPQIASLFNYSFGQLRKLFLQRTITIVYQLANKNNPVKNGHSITNSLSYCHSVTILHIQQIM